MSTHALRARLADAKHLPQIAVTVTVVLLVTFFAVTVSSLSSVSDQVLRMKSGPYPASVAAGSVETMLVQLKTIAEQTSYPSSQQEIDQIAERFRDIDVGIRRELTFIAEHDPDVEDRARDLACGYNELSVTVDKLIMLHSSGAVTDEFAHREIIPRIDALLAANTAIIDETAGEVDEICATVRASIARTIITASALIAGTAIAIACGIIVLQEQRRRQNLLHEKLKRALREAEIANSSKSTFLTSVSHDIRTPLNAIIGLSAIARANPDDKRKIDECLKHIDTSSRNLLNLLNDVLDLGKIESGKMSLNEERFSLSKFIDDFAWVMRSPAKMKDLSFRVEVTGITNDVLIGDCVRLHQIMANLLSNAIKYTPEKGSVLLRIGEAGRDEQGRLVLEFVVSDTGIGMSPEFVARIFQPFEREENPERAHTDGIGLGMAITKEIVDLMNGEIDVSSAQGKGSVFTVRLPFKTPLHASVPCDLRSYSDLQAFVKQKNLEARGDCPTDRVQVQGRVLLAEDNKLNQEIAAELIGSFGAQVEVADDGREALDKVREEGDGAFDLIFMDWQMPRMNGLEATRAIIAFEEAKGRTRTPIVAMTANAFNEERERALEAGMDGFMAKPIDMGKLEHYLRRYMKIALPQKGDSKD